MIVQQNRKSPSTVLTAHNSTGNRTSMCNTWPMYFSTSDVYLCGDPNSRCGVLSDRVEQLELGRFVDLPVEEDLSPLIAVKESYDAYVNVYGHKLISLCKEQDNANCLWSS